MSPPSAPHPLPDPSRHDTPLGDIAAVPLPFPADDVDLSAWLDALPAEERALAEGFAPPRRAAFAGGRLALRAVLREVAPEVATAAILRTPRGAPAVPAGLLASVSHKRRLAVALARPRDAAITTLGIDLEERPAPAERGRPDLAPKILTPRERHALAALRTDDGDAYREAVRLHFALKEAVYKAIDPHVQRHVRFQEVEVRPGEPGAVPVRLLLPEFAGTGYVVRAWWQPLGAHLLALAAGPAR